MSEQHTHTFQEVAEDAKPTSKAAKKPAEVSSCYPLLQLCVYMFYVPPIHFIRVHVSRRLKLRMVFNPM